MFVKYSKGSTETGKLLIEKLKAKPFSSHVTKVSVVLNWGSISSEGKIAKWINKPSKVKVNSDKFKALQVFAQHGIAVPSATCVSIDAVEAWKYPFIARKPCHRGGMGLYYVENTSDIASALEKGATYFQQYIPKSAEWRVHVFDGKILGVFEKIKRSAPRDFWYEETMNAIGCCFDNDGYREIADKAIHKASRLLHLPDPIIRSLNRGWTFKEVELDPNLAIAAVAVEALGLTFGAVDIIKGSNDSKYYILEVNTGPGLNESMADRYVAAIKEYVHED